MTVQNICHKDTCIKLKKKRPIYWNIAECDPDLTPAFCGVLSSSTLFGRTSLSEKFRLNSISTSNNKNMVMTLIMMIMMMMTTIEKKKLLVRLTTLSNVENLKALVTCFLLRVCHILNSSRTGASFWMSTFDVESDVLSPQRRFRAIFRPLIGMFSDWLTRESKIIYSKEK